ncbi:MAG: hypothetical protein JWN93_3549 [Hyphomicrobiales bacterium]|jgi:uncharacterized protein (TIGR02301 family)|nr:hypothetical protein [Hyphomicrobiales bacterium]
MTRASGPAGRAVLRGLACALALALVATAPALAQQTRPRQSAPAPVAPAPAPLESTPPYERQLLRLAEIMGALAWLSDICGSGESAQWQKRMSALMDAEGATDARRERLAGAYNRGFRGYEAVHRSCTPSAELIMGRFLEEGARIARDVASQYAE